MDMDHYVRPVVPNLGSADPLGVREKNLGVREAQRVRRGSANPEVVRETPSSVIGILASTNFSR